jgi:hypothetical protein
LYWYSSLSIGARLSLASAALSATVVIVLVSLATATSPRNSLIDQGGTIIAGQLAQSSTEYILEKDRLALQALLTELTQKPLIAYARIEDENHQLLVESGSRQMHRNTMQAFTRTIQLHDGIVGYASVHVAGAASPAMSAVMVLLLGVIVLALVFMLLRSRLKGLDLALQVLAQRLGVAVAAGKGGAAAKTVADILHLCEALEQLAPQTTMASSEKRAVLALRLPALAADKLAAEQLAPIAEAVAQSAVRWQASIRERADGWLLLFTCGDDTAVRTLASARALQNTLSGDTDYAMAISIEPDTAPVQDTLLQGFHWQRLCDAAYQMAQGENALILTRLALSNNDVNQQVTVQQDDTEFYRVTGFRDDESEHQADIEAPAPCPVGSEPPPEVVH